MKKNGLFVGMFGIVLAFGFALMGCDDGKKCSRGGSCYSRPDKDGSSNHSTCADPSCAAEKAARMGIAGACDCSD